MARGTGGGSRRRGGDRHRFIGRGAPRRLLDELAARGLADTTLINNAGFGLYGPFLDQTPEWQAEMVDVNVRALTEPTRMMLPDMVARRKGAILNVASTAAFQAGPNMEVYLAIKACVLSLTEALHQEMKGTGIRISALCPGPTATEFGEVALVRGNSFAKLSADARSVVAMGLKGLDANQAIVIPGLMNKLTPQSGRIIPRAAMRRIVARLKP